MIKLLKILPLIFCNISQPTLTNPQKAVEIEDDGTEINITATIDNETIQTNTSEQAYLGGRLYDKRINANTTSQQNNYFDIQMYNYESIKSVENTPTANGTTFELFYVAQLTPYLGIESSITGLTLSFKIQNTISYTGKFDYQAIKTFSQSYDLINRQDWTTINLNDLFYQVSHPIGIDAGHIEIDNGDTELVNLGDVEYEKEQTMFIILYLKSSERANLSHTMVGNGILCETMQIQALKSNVIIVEPVDIPSIMFTILSMPFTFISQAFNLTLFAGTPYQINISQTFLAIIAIVMFIWIIKLILGKADIGSWLGRESSNFNKERTKQNNKNNKSKGKE